jgi:integrase
MGFKTQAQVDRVRLPEGKTDGYVWDDQCPGLSIRVQGSARRWVVWYQANGRRRKVTLGAVSGIALRDARIQAGRIVGDARTGRDELAERAAAKARAAENLGQLLDIYLERRAKPRQRPRTYAETKRYLQKRWSPLHGGPVDAVARRDVAARLEAIRVDHGPGAARKAAVYLSAAFTWAMRQGLADHNPLIGLETPPEAPRDRVLSPDELAALWSACERAGDFGRIVWLLMLTGARRTEVAAMTWAEIDLERRLWIIPADRAKKGRELEVPLSDQSLAVLPERRARRDLLFGKDGKGAFSGFSRAKASLERAAGLEARWVLHDIRRSVVTWMAEIGIEPHICEAVVGHISGHKAGIAGVYNRAAYREQKRAALVRWADWLEAVAKGKEPSAKVIALR